MPADSPDSAIPRSCELIRRFEGCELVAYADPVLGWAVPTIGYGSTGPAIVRGLAWTRAQAEADLVQRVTVEFLPAVRAALTKPIPDACVAACCSLAWNIGTRAFAGSSVARRINAGEMRGAADAFRFWNRAGGEVRAGLVKRREQERRAFLAGLQGGAPAPLVA